MRRVRIVGIGAGGPDQLSVEASDALRAADFALVTRKSQGDPLEAARRAVIARHAPDLEVIAIEDPERDRSTASTATAAGYEGAVADWHDARAAVYEAVLAERWAAGAGHAVFLVWGDPAFYDSTIRIVQKVLDRGTVRFEWDVLPGLSALQVLAARHRIVLHGVGEPVLVTTARRLADAVASGVENIVVMLVAQLDLPGLDGWQVWWGANLGTPTERLVAGRVIDVMDEIEAARHAAKQEAGWVMDVLLLRRPEIAVAPGAG